MNLLNYIVEPEGLLLTWQPQDEQSAVRTRRVVADIRKNEQGEYVFRYLPDTDDYQKAEASGFKGYPAFDIKQVEHKSGVLDSFNRRLPPRKREDFSDFLAVHRLPSPFSYSDVALLAYTGARLPSDGFSVVPVFKSDVAPCEYILEVAGFRHAAGADVALLQLGDTVTFDWDKSNPVDGDAIGIFHNGLRIGYVNRALRDSFSLWLNRYKIVAIIDRINGKPDRPLVYLRVSIL